MWTLQGAVIPAKAGIHAADLWKHAVSAPDSRLRGNDPGGGAEVFLYVCAPLFNGTAPDPLQGGELQARILVLSGFARIAVLQALVLRQTFETCPPLILAGWRYISKLTLSETAYDGGVQQSHSSICARSGTV